MNESIDEAASSRPSFRGSSTDSVVTRQASEAMLAQVQTGPRIEAAILRSEGWLGELLRIAELK